MRPILGTAGILIAIFCGLIADAPRQNVTASLGDLIVYARSVEKTKERTTAVGNVEVHYKDISLTADRIEVNNETKDVVAEGHVSLHLPAEVLDCSRISFNLDTRQGKFEDALGRVQPTILYEAASIERKADNLYNLKKASFTACTQPSPRWKFSFAEANLKKDDYVEMWGAVISVKGIPIFYMPYMRYPLNQERSTGFLIPQVGFSQVKGFQISQGFYWAIARNMDATFSLDYYASKGEGAGVEYRYLFPGGTGGDLHLYYFTFKSIPGVPDMKDAYILRWRHNQLLPGGFSLVANVDYQTSFDFLKEFDNDFRRALVFNRTSQIYLSKAWSYFSFSARASQFETSFPGYGVAGSVIMKYLPQINFDSFKIRFLKYLYFSFGSSFSSIQYGWDFQYKTKNQIKLTQFSLAPVVSLPVNSIPWLNTNFSFEGMLNYYWQSYKPNSYVVGDQPLMTTQYAANIDLVGPVFYRIWDLGKGEGAGRLKHLIEPFVTYRYESPVENANRVISAYGFYRYHYLNYGLTNHLMLKTGSSPREILTWGISQSYFFSPEDSPNKYYMFEGQIPRFTEVQSYLRFYPASRFSLDVAGSYNTYAKGFSGIRLGAGLGTPADDIFVNVNWYKSMSPWYKNAWYDRSQVGLYGGIKLPFLSLEALGQMDLNITEKKMLYSAWSIVYHYQCLDLKADIRVFNFRDKPEIQYRFSLGLGNIGRTTDFMGGANFN